MVVIYAVVEGNDEGKGDFFGKVRKKRKKERKRV